VEVEDAHCDRRFTKALSVYPHLHVLVLDGGYAELEDGTLIFVEDTAPTPAELRAIEDRIEAKFSGWLKRHGFLDDEGPEEQELDGWWTQAANEPSGVLAPVGSRRSSRWEVDARVRVAAKDRKGREQLCLYVARPPFAEAQLDVLDEDRVRLTFRSPMRSGQRDLVLHPLALMRKLAWLVPPPTQHQLRYAGVLAPAAKLRPLVVPAGRVGVQRVWFGDRKVVPAEPVPYRTSWARLLARVYDADGHACPCCPGTMRPVGAVLPPEAAEWIRAGRIDVLVGTGPPQRQLALAL
jgi:catechol 2,3-dioxygenase-like lactoylglutathione lyase family enzyme